MKSKTSSWRRFSYQHCSLKVWMIKAIKWKKLIKIQEMPAHQLQLRQLRIRDKLKNILNSMTVIMDQEALGRRLPQQIRIQQTTLVSISLTPMTTKRIRWINLCRVTLLRHQLSLTQSTLAIKEVVTTGRSIIHHLMWTTTLTTILCQTTLTLIRHPIHPTSRILLLLTITIQVTTNKGTINILCTISITITTICHHHNISNMEASWSEVLHRKWNMNLTIIKGTHLNRDGHTKCSRTISEGHKVT
jgi:hypothetical protein